MKRSWLLIAVCSLVAVLSVPVPASALTQRTGDSVTVDESIDDDLYVFGQTVEVAGDVDGDVIAFGQTIRITGDVTGDVIAAGQTISVGGSVGGSVRAAGQDVRVESKVAEDVVAAGQTVRLTRDGSAGRDAAVAGNDVQVQGEVGRNVLAGAQRLRIDAPVGGDVTADVERLSVGPQGRVEGDVRYFSEREAQIDGEVAGDTDRYPPRTDQVDYRRPSPAAQFFWAVVGWVRDLIGLALFSLLALLAARPIIERAAWESWYGRPLVAGLIGFAVFMSALPIAFFVFLIGLLLGGWWIAFVWLAVVWIVGLLGAVVISLAVGMWVVRALAHRTIHPMLAVLLGVLIYSLVGAVPILGWLAVFVGVLVGMGGVVLTLYGSRSAPSAPAVTAQPAATVPGHPGAPTVAPHEGSVASGPDAAPAPPPPVPPAEGTLPPGSS